MSVREALIARTAEIYEKYSKGDVEALANAYTENGILYVDKKKPIIGRQAIKDSLGELAATVKTMELDKWEYFEQFNENTAYTLAFTKCLDSSGAVFGRYKGCILWRKIGDTWFIDHDIFNELPK